MKLGGGFYCGLAEIEGKEPPYIVNGFFMSMRSEFMQPGTEVHYFTVEWDSAKLSGEDFQIGGAWCRARAAAARDRKFASAARAGAPTGATRSCGWVDSVLVHMRACVHRCACADTLEA